MPATHFATVSEIHTTLGIQDKHSFIPKDTTSHKTTTKPTSQTCLSTNPKSLDIRVHVETSTTMRVQLPRWSTERVNVLRRTLLSSVPVMAIDEVLVEHNSSSLQDEVLAHRLGLVALSSEDVDLFSSKGECGDCPGCTSGCSGCRVEFSLDVVGTKNRDRTVVRASRMESSDSRVLPIEGETLICFLYPGQSIKLRAYARKGTLKENAKWSAITVANIDDEDHTMLSFESTGVMAPRQVLRTALSLMGECISS